MNEGWEERARIAAARRAEAAATRRAARLSEILPDGIAVIHDEATISLLGTRLHHRYVSEAMLRQLIREGLT